MMIYESIKIWLFYDAVFGEHLHSNFIQCGNEIWLKNSSKILYSWLKNTFETVIDVKLNCHTLHLRRACVHYVHFLVKIRTFVYSTHTSISDSDWMTLYICMTWIYNEKLKKNEDLECASLYEVVITYKIESGFRHKKRKEEND